MSSGIVVSAIGICDRIIGGRDSVSIKNIVTELRFVKIPAFFPADKFGIFLVVLPTEEYFTSRQFNLEIISPTKIAVASATFTANTPISFIRIPQVEITEIGLHEVIVSSAGERLATSAFKTIAANTSGLDCSA